MTTAPAGAIRPGATPAPTTRRPCAIRIAHAWGAVVSDLGRPGHARHGIPAGGAADQYAATVANLLAGNADTEPLIEVTAGHLTFVADRPVLVAVTGSPATVAAGGRPARSWDPVALDAGESLSISDIRIGLRVYVAVNGCWRVPRMLGSAAPDPLLGFGTALSAGSVVDIDSAYQPIDHPVLRHPVFLLGADVPRLGDPLTVDLTAGPDGDGATRAQLVAGRYTVHHDSDQIGLRLSGPVPVLAAAGEQLSKGVPAGALEVTPAGELVLLMRGRPVTAGYPVVAVATRVAQSSLGQARPGRVVRFRWQSTDEAVAAYRRQRHALALLAGRVRVAFDSVGVPHDPRPDRVAEHRHLKQPKECDL